MTRSSFKTYEPPADPVAAAIAYNIEREENEWLAEYAWSLARPQLPEIVKLSLELTRGFLRMQMHL